MRWHRPFATWSSRASPTSWRKRPSFRHHSLNKSPELDSWDIETFRMTAFQPSLPAKLPISSSTSLPATKKWFIHYDDPDQPSSTFRHGLSELNLPFWQAYEDLIVPMELTQTSTDGSKTFNRSDAPLKLFLQYSAPIRSALAANTSRPAALRSPSLYIAQCPLTDLPSSLQADLPTPSLVLKVGKGDIYDSSLWMGRPPTFTPLHRDPNPNLFMQLAGHKVVRLFPPDAGKAMFDLVQASLGAKGHASFRGEEMMQGAERNGLERIVWDDQLGDNADAKQIRSMRDMGCQSQLTMGEALFIPKGWWHSIKGVGSGMNASVNWWFR